MEYARRMEGLRAELSAAGIDLALITDADSVYYLTGYYDYLHMEFGRPTVLAVPVDGDSLLITPAIDAAMASATAKVDRIAPWNDGAGDEWRGELRAVMKGAAITGLDMDHAPPRVRGFLEATAGRESLRDITPVIAAMRMIKSADELRLARHAGAVAEAMMSAARETIADQIPEFEVALAASAAGARRAASLLNAHYDGAADMSPTTQFLQIMASGPEIVKTHHRASTRIMRRGEPVFMCFCGMTNFRRFKLGFDRTFWIGEIADRRQAELYALAVASQRAALAVLKPGVRAESVHAAYAEVIRDAGFDYPFRCGRATGYSYLERPQLVEGDTTILQPGMVLAVDGSVAAGDFRAQVGDSVIITEDGYEPITRHPVDLDSVVLPC